MCEDNGLEAQAQRVCNEWKRTRTHARFTAEISGGENGSARRLLMGTGCVA